MTLDEIENYIEKRIIEDMLPEVKRKFIYQITDQDPIVKNNNVVTAELDPSVNPPLIRFFTKHIEWIITLQGYTDEAAKAWIDRLISHEVAHVFQSNELGANANQKLKIFR